MTLMLDSASGRTWQLKMGTDKTAPVWEPISRGEFGKGYDPDNATHASERRIRSNDESYPRLDRPQAGTELEIRRGTLIRLSTHFETKHVEHYIVFDGMCHRFTSDGRVQVKGTLSAPDQDEAPRQTWFAGTVSLEEAKRSRTSPIPMDQLKDLTVSARGPIK
jgi:hypothetical protein